jgi:hypothetical protein
LALTSASAGRGLLCGASAAAAAADGCCFGCGGLRSGTFFCGGAALLPGLAGGSRFGAVRRVGATFSASASEPPGGAGGRRRGGARASGFALILRGGGFSGAAVRIAMARRTSASTGMVAGRLPL